MEYRRLGNAGMKVSSIALGGWINYTRKNLGTDEAEAIVKTAYDGGVNFFDLADAYGSGEAEEWMGSMLRQYPRHTLVISSKLFWPMSDDINDRGLSRKHIMASIDKSLQRLDTDYLDIYFCHRPDPETPIIETARAMDDLVHRGKILYWGTSLWEPEQINEACDLCEKYGLYPPQAEQPEFSMLANRHNVEDALLPTTQSRGIGLTVFSPLAMGALTGKYDSGIPDDSRLKKVEWASQSEVFSDDNLERVRQLKPIADDLGLTRPQLALAWVLRHEGISSAITGASKVSHIEESIGAAEKTLSDDVLAEIARILN